MEDRLHWKNGARCAVMLTFDLDGDTTWKNGNAHYEGGDKFLKARSVGLYGPNRGAHAILDLLKKYGVPGTFFVPGKVAEDNPGLIRRIDAEGHEIGQHGYTHEMFFNYGRERQIEIIEKCQNIFCDLIGKPARGFRTPSGDWSLDTPRLLYERGVDYSSSMRGNDRPYHTAIDGDEELNAKLAHVGDLADYLVKKSIWIFGGDGWAYDIGFGGLDHVLASGENVNVLVFDTEVYSNTGGQSSKSTPTSAVAKFAAAGKKVAKKDLGRIAMTYGYVYVAQCAMGADKNQLVKILSEAEAYDGPSLIICYAPCINHGLKAGMGKSQEQEKKAVEAGYWHLYHYNPELEEQGKNPFVLDSKEPKASFRDFLMSENRYTSLAKTNPEMAEQLYAKAERDAKRRYRVYKSLAEAKPLEAE